ncbi:MAG: hypothetical protein DI539_27175 [Flavobacterium psychrophilum]|nr:MAG: hypothetical protein DI539_27175 [Flavobacterium psychrophilum]
MNQKTITQADLHLVVPSSVFQDGVTYILRENDDDEWLEIGIKDLFIIRDSEDLLAAMVLQLRAHYYIEIEPDDIKMESSGNGAYLIEVPIRELLDPDETETIDLILYPVEQAKDRFRRCEVKSGTSKGQ